MDWRNNVISELGEGMGISGLTFGDSGVVCFEFDHSGKLYIETKVGGVMLSLSRALDSYNTLATLETALKGCHYKNSFPYCLQVGVRNNEIFSCVFISDGEFDRPTTERVMQYLMEKANALN